MPYKILTLKPEVDDQLQTLQDEQEVNAVTPLGRDGTYNNYILVDYDLKMPAPLSGSVPVNEVDTPPESGSL